MSQGQTREKSVRSTHAVEEFVTDVEVTSPNQQELYMLYSSNSAPPIKVTVKANGRDLDMTGASVSHISEETFNKVTVDLQLTDISLKSYSGHQLVVLGRFNTEIMYQL